MIAVSAPAALVFYVFTRDCAIAEAEQFAATAADRRVLGLNYTLRLGGTSLYRFDLMLRDSLATPAREEEVPRFTAGFERNQADMLVPRRSGFNVACTPASRFIRDAFYRFHARTQRLMSLYAGGVAPRWIPCGC